MGPVTLVLHPTAGEHRTTPAETLWRFGRASLMPLAWLILPNLPLLLLRKKLTLVPHGIINLECLLLGILSLFLPRALVFVLLFAEMAGAFIYEICYSFQFRLADLITASKSLPDLPPDRIVEFAVTVTLVLLVAALVAFAIPRPKHRGRTSLMVLAMILAILVTDYVDGSTPLAHADVTETHRLSIAPWLELGMRGEFFSLLDNLSKERNTAPMDSASAAMMASLPPIDQGSAVTRPNVVVILVESWGLISDPGIAQALTAPYDNPQLRSAYDVRFGTVPFDGMTVPGEARELCQTHMGFGILGIHRAESRSCLPEKFASLGYDTAAVHGYTGNFFQRSRWYPQLGFEQMWFQPELERQGLPVCPGAFPGICGPGIAQWIGKRLLAAPNQKPHFIYWVTLNSHIPLPIHPGLPPDQLCSIAPVIGNSVALCSWFRILHALHASVVRLALQPSSRPTVFVLVGDHAPPFANPRLREHFSQTVVPYAVLVPRALQPPAPGSGSRTVEIVKSRRAPKGEAVRAEPEEGSEN